MRRHTTRIIGAAVSILFSITFCLSSSATISPVSSTPPVPVITLSSLQGFTAEISDYHYDAQQNFCFTLTNTSSLPINALGADLGGVAFVSIVSQTDNNALRKFIVEGPFPTHTLNGVPMSFVLFSSEGLAPGSSTTICLSGLTTPADEIAHNLFVTFFPEVTLDCEAPEVLGDERILVQFTRLTDTEQCLLILNISDETVTGVGFTSGTGPVDLLSVTPSHQPFNQHLRLSRMPGPVAGFPDISLTFALLTGGQFSHGVSIKGVEPGEASSQFCFAGNFAGIRLENVAEHTYVRVPGVTRPCVNLGPPIGAGQTGVLAGEPR